MKAPKHPNVFTNWLSKTWLTHPLLALLSAALFMLASDGAMDLLFPAAGLRPRIAVIVAAGALAAAASIYVVSRHDQLRYRRLGQDVAELQRAEQALRRSEERYRSLFDAMTEGFAVHEILCDERGEPCDYRFLDVNPAFERLTGLVHEDVVGRTHNEALPGDNPRWVRVYGAVALTGEPAQFEDYSPALERHYEVYAYRPAPVRRRLPGRHRAQAHGGYAA